MLSGPRRAPDATGTGTGTGTDAGFTLIEMMVVVALLGVVLAVLSGVLVSLANTENRVQALAANEESVRFALDRVGRDLRSANTLDQFTTLSAYSTKAQVELGPAGSTSYVMWSYDSSAKTLSRLIEPGPTGGTPTGTATVLTGVNSVTFSYFDSKGNDLVTASGSTPANVANCAIRVRVAVSAASNPGPQPFTETKDIELRNRLPGGMLGCAT